MILKVEYYKFNLQTFRMKQKWIKFVQKNFGVNFDDDELMGSLFYLTALRERESNIESPLSLQRKKECVCKFQNNESDR